MGRKSKISIQRSKAMKEYWSNVKSISQEKNIPIKQARKQITTKPKYISKKSLERSIRTKAYWNEVKSIAKEFRVTIEQAREHIKSLNEVSRKTGIPRKKYNIKYSKLWDKWKKEKANKKERKEEMKILKEDLDYEFES